MKKILGILLFCVGVIFLPNVVDASLDISIVYSDSISKENQIETIYTLKYINNSETDYEGGLLTLIMTPYEESTSVSFINSDNVILQNSFNNSYVIEIGRVAAGEEGNLGTVTWLADNSSSELTGDIRCSWSGLNVDKIIEEGTSGSADLLINYLETDESEEPDEFEKIYSVDIIWGSLEYNFTKNYEGNYEWSAVIEENNTPANVVSVQNSSNVDVSASIHFDSSIEGVEASYRAYSSGEDGEIVESFSDTLLILAPKVEAGVTYLTSTTWMIDLTGGTYEDVENAYNSAERKIGTVTITISQPLGDVG